MKRLLDETAADSSPLVSLNNNDNKSNNKSNSSSSSYNPNENHTETTDASNRHHPTQPPCAAVRVNEAAWDSLIAGMLDACPRKRLRGRPRRDGLPPQPRPKAPHPPTALLNHFVLPPRSPPAFLTLPTPDIGPASLIRPSWVPSSLSLTQGPSRSLSLSATNPSETHPATKQSVGEGSGHVDQTRTMLITPPSLTSPFPSPTEPTSFSSSLSSPSPSSTQSRLQVMQIPFLLNAAPLTN